MEAQKEIGNNGTQCNDLTSVNDGQTPQIMVATDEPDQARVQGSGADDETRELNDSTCQCEETECNSPTAQTQGGAAYSGIPNTQQAIAHSIDHILGNAAENKEVVPEINTESEVEPQQVPQPLKENEFSSEPYAEKSQEITRESVVEAGNVEPTLEQNVTCGEQPIPVVTCGTPEDPEQSEPVDYSAGPSSGVQPDALYSEIKTIEPRCNTGITEPSVVTSVTYETPTGDMDVQGTDQEANRESGGNADVETQLDMAMSNGANKVESEENNEDLMKQNGEMIQEDNAGDTLGQNGEFKQQENYCDTLKQNEELSKDAGAYSVKEQVADTADNLNTEQNNEITITNEPQPEGTVLNEPVETIHTEQDNTITETKDLEQNGRDVDIVDSNNSEPANAAPPIVIGAMLTSYAEANEEQIPEDHMHEQNAEGGNMEFGHLEPQTISEEQFHETQYPNTGQGEYETSEGHVDGVVYSESVDKGEVTEQHSNFIEDSSGVDVDGGLPTFSLCIDSVRGEVPWPPSGSEDESSEQVTSDPYPTTDDQTTNANSPPPDYIDKKHNRRGRRPEVDLSSIPFLRQKNNAGTAEGYYSLNSNIRGLVCWLAHNCRTFYMLTITPFGMKVDDTLQDATESVLICELCNFTCTDSNDFLSHCSTTGHIGHKNYAVKRSMKLYSRQMVARYQAQKSKDKSPPESRRTALKSTASGGFGRCLTMRSTNSAWGGQIKKRYQKRLGFLGQKQSKFLPEIGQKRGPGRPRLVRDGEGVPIQVSQVSMQNRMPFHKNTDESLEAKRVLRVRPIPRHEDADFQYGDACDIGIPAVPGVPTHHQFPGQTSTKRAFSEIGEPSPPHEAKRRPFSRPHRQLSETYHESDASSTSTSFRSHQWRSGRDPTDSSPHFPRRASTTCSEELPVKRKRGRPRKNRQLSGGAPSSTQTSPSPIRASSTAAHKAPAETLLMPMPTPLVNPKRCTSPHSTLTVQNFFKMKRDRVNPELPSTSAAPPNPDHEALLNTLTDDQMWRELVDRQIVYECVCGFSFSTPSAFYLHKACHNTEKETKCSFCGLDAPNWMAFHAHFFNHKAPTSML